MGGDWDSVGTLRLGSSFHKAGFKARRLVAHRCDRLSFVEPPLLPAGHQAWSQPGAFSHPRPPRPSVRYRVCQAVVATGFGPCGTHGRDRVRAILCARSSRQTEGLSDRCGGRQPGHRARCHRKSCCVHPLLPTRSLCVGCLVCRHGCPRNVGKVTRKPRGNVRPKCARRPLISMGLVLQLFD